MTAQRGTWIARDGSNNGTTPKGARLATGGLLAHDGASPLSIRKGVVFDGGGPVVAGTAGMSYDVRALVAVTLASAANGPTMVPNDASVNVATDPAPGSGSRVDVIWVRQKLLTGDGGSETGNEAEIGVARGAASGSPSAPSIPVGALELARTTVAAGTTATNALTISQTHLWTVGSGAPIPVRDNNERSALTPFTGMIVNHLGSGVLQRYNGTAWIAIGNEDEGVWVDVPGVAPFTSTMRVRKVGKLVVSTGSVARATGSSASFNTAATIPVGYRPATVHEFNPGVPRVTQSIPTRGQITSAGNVQIQMGGEFGGPMACSTSWFTD